jgi:predicted Zn finger-like uncharacterized protein
MIIECKNCLQKFSVKNTDIPVNGRTVQCSNCSTQWFQVPITSTITTDNLNINEVPTKVSSSVTTHELDVDDIEREHSKNEFVASDGKKYKFLGSQWAEVLPSGKNGRLARKKITAELNKLAGKKTAKKIKTINTPEDSSDQYQETDKGMGIFNFIIVSIILIVAIILLLDTFKNQLIPFFPNLDNHLVYIFETLNNIYIIIKDFFNNYK